MATVLQIIADNTDMIRNKVAPGSITKINDADLRDQVARELRDRGVLQATTKAGLATLSHDNTKLVLVYDVGLFVPLETIEAPNNINTFSSADSGWLWLLVFSSYGDRDILTISEPTTYELEDGSMAYEFWIKSETAQTVKIGLTSGGDEIMLEEELESGAWKVVSYRVFADGDDVDIFFGGFTDESTVVILKRPI